MTALLTDAPPVVEHPNCTECGRPMRLHGETFAQFPGGTKPGARGKCHTCNTRDLREGHGPLLTRKYPPRHTPRVDVTALPEMDRNHPCRQDPEAWFPDGDGSTPTSAAASEPAKAACRTCPHVTACLTYALKGTTPGTVQGIWGATTEADRRSIRRHAGNTHNDTTLDDLIALALEPGWLGDAHRNRTQLDNRRTA